MTTTEQRYAEAGMRSPEHTKRVSSDIHSIDTEHQPVGRPDITAEPSSTWTKSQLEEYAADRLIDISSASNNEKRLAAIVAAEANTTKEA